jgi:hypothetical protein
MGSQTAITSPTLKDPTYRPDLKIEYMGPLNAARQYFSNKKDLDFFDDETLQFAKNLVFLND